MVRDPASSPRRLAPWAWLALSLLLLWIGGLALRCDAAWLAIGSVAACVCAAGAIAARRMRGRDPARQPGAIVAARREVEAAIRALKAAGAAQLPWYVVLGPAGAGKSAALTGAGCLPLPAEAGEAVCRWWIVSGAVFIECVEDAAAFTALLRALRRHRRCPTIAGAVAALALPELLAADEGGLARIAGGLRGSLTQLAAALAAEIPVWLLLTKSDHLGGFKEFAVALADAERRAPCGFSLPPGAAVADRLSQLLATVRTRRLAALQAAATDEQARKAFQFPGQLAAAQRWIASLVGRLGGDGAHGLCGIYLASAGAVAGRQPFLGAAPAVGAPGTIFLETRQLGGVAPARPEAAAAAGGIFLRDLFAEVLPAQRALARPDAQARRYAAGWRWTLIAAVPAAAALVVLIALWRAAETVDLAHASRYVLAKAREAAGDPERSLVALEALAPQVAAAARQPGAGALAALLGGEYATQLKRLLIVPAASRLAADLDALRARAGSGGDSRELEELLRAYRMLGGELHPDAQLLGRALDARWSDGPCARRHLAFLLAHLDDIDGWTIPADHHLVAQVEHELEDSLWLRESYDQALGALQASFPTLGRDRLVTGPFRDALDVGGGFSALFTQDGWDQAMRPALAARARELSARFARIGAARPARELEARLGQRFADELEQRWNGLLAGTAAHSVASLDDAPAAIALLSGHQSPYREFVVGVWQGGRLRRSALDLAILQRAERLGWLDPALDALAALGKEVERFLAATEPGKRSADPRRLRELAEAFDGAAQKMSAAAKAIDDRARQAAVIAGLQGILRSLFAAAAADTAAEQDRLWAERVRRPFAATLAGRYPLDLAGAAEVAPEAFSRQFNPVSGTYWSAIAGIEELRAIRAVGVDLLPVSREYEALLRHAQDIRQAMFADKAERICAPFALALRLREGVKDERVAVADVAFGIYDRPDGMGRLVWKESGAETARLSLTTTGGQVFATAIASGPWAAVRLVRAGAPMRRSDGCWVCTWSFDAPALGRGATVKADAVLSGGGFERALAGDLLTGLCCPESIGPTP